MLIVPAATASLLFRQINQIMLLAVCIAAVSSVFGLHVSFYANVATSPAIVLVACGMFVVALVTVAGRRSRLPLTEDATSDRVDMS